jgi:hypothetical protein
VSVLWIIDRIEKFLAFLCRQLVSDPPLGTFAPVETRTCPL